MVSGLTKNSQNWFEEENSDDSSAEPLIENEEEIA
jgi:hypothetical protein